MKKIKNVLNFIWKVIYKLIAVAVILMFVFAVVQKSSDNRESIFGIKIFTVITGSMIPVYEIGDIIIVKDVLPEEIIAGDDIVYIGEKGTYRDKTITHRVQSIKKKEDGNYGIITKGVANSSQDPEINQTQVLGKVIGHVPIFSFILKLITNIYVIIMILVVIFIYKNIKRIINMNAEEG